MCVSVEPPRPGHAMPCHSNRTQYHTTQTRACLLDEEPVGEEDGDHAPGAEHAADLAEHGDGPCEVVDAQGCEV